MKTVIKFRDERKGEHVHSRIFMGPDEDHLALTGRLIMRIGEWQLFGAALILGVEEVNRGHPERLTLLLPDQQQVVEGG